MLLEGGVHPTSKDGSALDYPSSSTISSIIGNSDPTVRNMFLNSQTLDALGKLSWALALALASTLALPLALPLGDFERV